MSTRSSCQTTRPACTCSRPTPRQTCGPSLRLAGIEVDRIVPAEQIEIARDRLECPRIREGGAVMKKLIVAIAVAALGVGSLGVSRRRPFRDHPPGGRVCRHLVRLGRDEPRRDRPRVDHAGRQRSRGRSRGRRPRQARGRSGHPAREGPGRQGHRHRALQRDRRGGAGMVLRRGLRLANVEERSG